MAEFSDNKGASMPNSNPDRTDLKIHLLGEEIEATGKRMEDTEIRYRFRFPDGTSYHHTLALKGGWQNAHYHMGLIETYVVIEGAMIMAVQKETGPSTEIYEKGATVSTAIGQPHNVYLYAGSVIGTITHGTPVGNPDRKGSDWYPAPELEAWSVNQQVPAK